MVTDDQYTRFLQLIALTEMYCKEYSKALQFCEYLGSIAREKSDDRLLYNYNYMCAMTQFGMEQLENQINGYVDRCRNIARKWGDELAEYKPQIIKLMSDCNYWRDIYIDYYDRGVSEEMIEKAERFGLKNILAYIYIYCFTADQETLQKAAKNKEILFHFNRGVELATEIENYELLISAYTKNIVVFSRVGCYDYVEDEDKYWLDTLFMKYLLETMMAVAEGRLQEAKQKFDEAENIMNMDKEKRYFSFLFFYMYRKGLFGIQTIVRSYRSLSGGYLVCSTALWK